MAIRNLVSVLLLTAAVALADQTALTTGGRTVTLKDDGTWEYVATTVATGSGFRGVKWGVTPAEVRSSETVAPTAEVEGTAGPMLLYSGSVAGLPCQYAYIFAGEVLTRGKYIFTVEHSNKNVFIDDYQSIKEQLTAKYGEAEEVVHWKKDLLKSDRQHWGMAISVGDLVYLSEWSTAGTKIYLVLQGDNYEITLGLEYSSTELKGLEEAATKKAASEGL